MGTHSRPRKGFNKTMAVAIAAGMTITGGVQVAAPADSMFAASAHAAEGGGADVVRKMEFPEIAITGLHTYAFADFSGMNIYYGKVLTKFSHMEGNLGYYDVFVALPNMSTLGKGGITGIGMGNSIKKALEKGFTYTVELDPAYGGSSVWFNPNPPTAMHANYQGVPGNSQNYEPRTHFKLNPKATPLKSTYEFTGDKYVFDIAGGQSLDLAKTEGANGYMLHNAIVVDYNKHEYIPGSDTAQPRIAPTATVKDLGPAVHGKMNQYTPVNIKKLAEVQEPVVKPTTVKQGDAAPAASSVIDQTFPKMFRVKDVAWVGGNPSTATPGPVKKDVKVTYDDGSTDTVSATVNVVAKTTQADTNNPVGKKVTVQQDKPAPDAKTAIANTNELKNVKSYTWKTKPSTAKVGPSKQTVVVEYNDGSKDEVVVDFEVTKSTTNAEDYQPTPVAQNVKYGDPVVKDANKLFSNWPKMPKGTTSTPVNPPAKVTEPVDVTYTIKYPDGSSEQVKVKHTPGKMSDAYDPKGKDVKTGLNGKPDAKEGIDNIGDMPGGTTYAWKGGAPKTSERGKFPATVVVKYSDGSTDEVAVNVVVTATDAEVHTPKPKPIVVDNGDKPKPEDGIDNKDQLPDGTDYTWQTMPDTTKPGNFDGRVRVKYPDGSYDDVTVPVTVKSIADNYDPQPKPITVNSGVTPKPEDGIANKDKLPKDATYKWEKTPDTSKPGTTDSVVIVTYKDGSTDRVTVPVTVRSMAEVYNPVPKPIVVDNGSKPNPADGIGNKDKLPKGTKYTWEKAPDTSKPGKTEGVVTVTYPDGTKDRVTVPVTVRTQAEQYDPKPKPIESWTNENPPAIDGIMDPDKLPKGTKFDWEKKPDTTKPGDTSGVVKVTYPDGSTDRVTVPVRVFLSGDDYQKIQDDIDNLNKEIGRINGEIDNLKGDVNTLKTQMKKAQEDIARLKAQVKDLEDRMKAAEKRLDGHDKDIADLKRRMADAERRLDNIDKQIAQILAELERLDGNEIVKGVRNADNSITLVKKDGRTVEIPPATKYGLEQCTAQLGGGLMALVPTLIVLSQVGNAVHLPGFEQQMIAMQKQAGMYNPQIADFVSKHGPALAAGAVGLAVIGTMFIPGTCGDKSIADALGESLRGNPNAVNPNVRETHELNGSSRFVPKQGTEGKQGKEGETATAGSSLNIGKGDQPDKPAEQPATSSSDKGVEKEAGTAAGATVPETANGNATADVLEDIASLTETGEDTEDFGLAVADAFENK